MKLKPLLVSFILGATCTALYAATPAAFPQYAVPNSEVRELPVNAAGRHYQLLVGLPASYQKNPERRFPVVYVTDGYWDFLKMTAIEGTLVYDKMAPEFIIVGIGYAGENLDYGNLRRWELTPVPFGDKGEGSGHAADYLRSIEQDIIPLIDREYRTDPKQRILAGASLGGLFTLYSMYSRPELFSGYIAATPAIAVADSWFKQYEEAFAQSGKPLKARLYMAVGGEEDHGFRNPTIDFAKRLDGRHYPGFAHAFRVVEGEKHAGMQLEAYTRGLIYYFAGSR